MEGNIDIFDEILITDDLCIPIRIIKYLPNLYLLDIPLIRRIVNITSNTIFS